MSDKPVIFISHATEDKAIALVLQQQIIAALGIDASNAFLSVDSYAIPSGSDWFEEIKKSLDRADALAVIVSPYSMNSIWVGYEIGYFWHKAKGKERIYPLIVPETELKGPIERLQGKSLSDPAGLKAFFNKLCEEFMIKDSEKADISAIVQAANNAVESIKQALRDYLDYEYEPRAWINYRKLDRELGIPKGSAKKYFPEVASNWTIDESKRYSGGTALIPPDSQNDPF